MLAVHAAETSRFNPPSFTTYIARRSRLLPQRAGMRLRAWTICTALVLVLQAATAQDTAAPSPKVKSGKARAVPFASLFATLSADKKSKFLELTKRMRMLKTLPKEEKAPQSKVIDQEIHKVLGKASYAEYKALAKARNANKSAGKAGGEASAPPVPDSPPAIKVKKVKKGASAAAGSAGVGGPDAPKKKRKSASSAAGGDGGSTGGSILKKKKKSKPVPT